MNALNIKNYLNMFAKNAKKIYVLIVLKSIDAPKTKEEKILVKKLLENSKSMKSIIEK